MTTTPAPATPPGAPDLDPVRVIRSRGYLSALLLAALLGVPVSALAYAFLALVGTVQGYLVEDLPSELFGGAAPA